ncbi:MAG: hypothetical protein K0S28_1751 [Paucimonas sp.]|nr:hypothetical protein [Paucimonas sp.]
MSALLLMLYTKSAEALTATSQSLADMSLEELATIKVTSVSRRAESLADAPAAIYVISSDEIRRSGATTLPEALRLAPNLQVARVDARNYAVTARGFNNALENKLLVLMDGRSIYSPLFSGVFWDAQDVVMNDIERIEVISGPGATMWGANAVNGVINIITRSASDTQGTLAQVDAGPDARSASGRVGGKFGAAGHYRIYGKYAANDDLRRGTGAPDNMGWHRAQAGFRADWGNADDGVTLQGDGYRGELHQPGTRDIYIEGANLNAAVTRRMSDRSAVNARVYWDYTKRDQPGALIEHLNTLNIEGQQAIELAGGHQLTWGAGYKMAADRVRNDVAFAFLPGRLNMHWGNLFVQDEFDVRPDLRLSGGVKLERNNYTGTEILPTVRLAWKPVESSLWWGSLSRSVRAPSRIDRDFYAPTSPIMTNGEPRYIVAGGPDFESEVANVVELGYRGRPNAALSYSVTAFTAAYDKLRTLETNSSGFDATFQNLGEARTRGLEIWGTWQALRNWRLSGGLVAQRINTSLKPGSTDASSGTVIASNDPRSYWTFRSQYDLGDGKELDVILRRVGKLSSPQVPAYTGLNVRFGWQVTEELQLAVLGQNLADKSHREIRAEPLAPEVRRGVYLTLQWRS